MVRTVCPSIKFLVNNKKYKKNKKLKYLKEMNKIVNEKSNNRKSERSN